MKIIRRHLHMHKQTLCVKGKKAEKTENIYKNHLLIDMCVCVCTSALAYMCLGVCESLIFFLVPLSTTASKRSS